MIATRNGRTVLMLAALIVAVIGSSAPCQELETGTDAPPFELVGADGQTCRLSDFQDKQVVVVVWCAKPFTGGCTRQCESLRDAGEELRELDAACVAISCDSEKTNAEFAKALELDFPLLSDSDRSVAEAYGVVDDSRSVPRRWTFYIGQDGKILRIDKQGNVETRGADVVQALRELKNGEKDEG